MRKILSLISAAMMATTALAQDDGAMQDTAAPVAMEAEKAIATTIFLPEMELVDGGMDWSDLEHGMYYAISAPAEWKAAVDENGEKTENGWFMAATPDKTEYISINEYEDMLTWIDIKEEMAEEVTDSTAARAVRKSNIKSVHTVETNGEYLDILGTLSGHRQVSRNFQIMKYAGKYIMYDYSNKILRLLSIEPLSQDDIIKEEE